MEITKVERAGLTVVSDLIKIKYGITATSGDENATVITANILKNETSVGFFNMSRGGVVGFSLSDGNGLTAQEIIDTFQFAINDCYTLFHD